jgi:DNA-binding transcriptional ArsR family regulator
VALLDDPIRAGRAVEIIEALAHPVRVRLVAALCADEGDAATLASRLGLPATSLVEHLEALERLGLIQHKFGAGSTTYRIAEPALHGLVACMEECSR